MERYGHGILSILLTLLLVFVFPMGSGGEQATVDTEKPFLGTIDVKTLNPEQNVFGTISGDFMGYSLVTADMNNDLIDDLIVSAPFYSNQRGAVFIYFGPNYDRELIDEDANVRIFGALSGERIGLGIEVGDVDDDGLIDLLITGNLDPYLGISGYTQDLETVNAYLFLGANGWNRTMSVATDASVTFTGNYYEAFGWSSALGDIDNDGYDDVILGEIYSDGYSVFDGEIYMFQGGAVMESSYDVSMGEYDHRVFNTDLNYDTYGRLYNGIGISGIELGDINGDEYMDILVGSMYKFTDQMYSGEVEVVFGGRNMLKDMDLAYDTHLVVRSFTNYNLGLACAADINGDGIDDLIVTAPDAFYDRTGGIFTFWGQSEFTDMELSILDYDFLIRGPRSGFQFGVFPAGDLDGDGREDLAIHSRLGAGFDNLGSYMLLYMDEIDALPDPSIYHMKFHTPTAIVNGPTGTQVFGHYLKPCALTMDFDGDGVLEIVVSDFRQSGASMQPNAGVVTFIYMEETEIRLNYFTLLDGDGENNDVLGAGKTYHFISHVENTWALNDFKKIDFFFTMHGGDLEGKRLELFWDRGIMKISERNDDLEYINIDSSDVKSDGANGMFIYMNISFNPTVRTEDFMDLGLDVQAGKNLRVTQSVPNLFRVECDVELFGELNVTGDLNGRLSLGSFVQPGERIVVSGLRVVYEGTEASPPNSYFSISMRDNHGTVFLNSTSSGKDIHFAYKTQSIAGKEEIILTVVDLKGGAEDITGGATFYYVIDTDLPDPPTDLEVRADSDIDPLMGYDNDPNVWVLWSPAEDDSSNVIGYMYNTYDAGGTADGTFVDRTKFEYTGLLEGWNTIYVWSMDAARNFGPAISTSVFYDVNGPVFLTPTPAPGKWINTNNIRYEITIIDDGGSGVDGRTIEYAISNDDGRTYGAWEPTNLKRVGDQISVKLFINFREGQSNVIKWRAKDVAGNGYIESDPFQVKVDTIQLTYKDAIPQEPQDSSYVTCGITLDDIRGSGIEGTSIQYSVSLNGVSNYGPWESLDIAGSYETITVNTPQLYFGRDTVNYIKWRARDVAGNGYTYSDDIPIEITEVKRNSNPVPIITSPTSEDSYDTNSWITFDGRSSEDPDGDELKYLWYSDIDGFLGTDPLLERKLSAGTHRITLAISDGKANITYSEMVDVYLSLSTLDTDEDGIPDIDDPDDDNDGLLDIEEDRNRNGKLDFNETNPKAWDSDGDGVGDKADAAPLNPNIIDPESNLLEGWIVWFIIIVIIVLLLVAGVIFVLIQRTNKERLGARRQLRTTKRHLRRFEALTGVPVNDLPAIEAVQWALPSVIAEASEFILEPAPSEDLLPPSPEEGKQEPEIKVSKPELQDMEEPAPVAPQVEDQPAGPEPPSESAPGKIISCSLCNSEVPVPEGATSVECPLCGEIINL